MLSIDGSQGEGGGQVLRTALSLAMVTGQPFQIREIRARRPRPGLMRQHLAAVDAARAVCDGVVEGARLGASTLCFRPGTPRPGAHHFSVGSAGSTTLVLQTILPALLCAGGPSTLLLEGGTHNPMAPPFEHVARAFLPLLRRMGARVTAELERHGFYPAGGGRMTVAVEPCRRLEPLHLREARPIVRRRVRALVAKVPLQVAERELAVVRARLGWGDAECAAEEVRDCAGSANVVLLEVAREDVTEVATAFGARGVPAERVALAAVAEIEAYLVAGVPVGRHLADQLLLPLALGGGGVFRTLPLTQHARTNIDVIQAFGAARVRVTGEGPLVVVEVSGSARE